MNRYKLLYLVWLLPAYLLFLVFHQGLVYYSIIDTYENGTSYTANVAEFELKQIAAQTNGYIVLEFNTSDGEPIQRKLSLPVEMAGKLTDIRIIPIRYQENSFQEVVMMPTYTVQKGLVLTNIAMGLVGFLIALFAAIYAHRFTSKKLAGADKKIIIERID